MLAKIRYTNSDDVVQTGARHWVTTESVSCRPRLDFLGSIDDTYTFLKALFKAFVT